MRCRPPSTLAGRPVRQVHVVGGGSQNTLLCQALADRTGLPVVAGPVEATALGNVLVQGRAAGAISGGLADLRDLVAPHPRPPPPRAPLLTSPHPAAPAPFTWKATP